MLASVFDQLRSISFCRFLTLGQSCSCAALKISCRSRRTCPSCSRQPIMSHPAGASRDWPIGPFTCRATTFTSATAGVTQALPSHTGVEKLYPVIASNLPFRFQRFLTALLQRLTCPRQRAFAPGHPARYPASYAGPPSRGLEYRAPVSCRLSAAGLRFLGILFPPGNYAIVPSVLPAAVTSARTQTGLPRSAQSRRARTRVLSFPRDQWCSHGRHNLRDRHLPLLHGTGPAPRHSSHLSGGVDNEASTRVHAVHPSGLSLARGPGWIENRLGFFPGLHTPQLPATHARAGTGIEHLPGTTHPASTSPPIVESSRTVGPRFALSRSTSGARAAAVLPPATGRRRHRRRAGLRRAVRGRRSFPPPGGLRGGGRAGRVDHGQARPVPDRDLAAGIPAGAAHGHRLVPGLAP